MITADEFRRQYAKGGDKRTRKKTPKAKARTVGEGRVELIHIIFEDLEVYVHPDNVEALERYKYKKTK